MTTPKLLVMPGMTSPKYSQKYQNLYATVKEGAEKYGYEYHIVYYPGQEGSSSGLLTYSGALENAIIKTREISPDWVVGLSSGCEIVAGLLGSNESCTKNIKGAVIWGPCLKKTIKSVFKTDRDWQNYIENGKKDNNTYFSPDFIETTPCISELIKYAAVNMRISRGSNDEYSIADDISTCAQIHQKFCPQKSTEILEIKGLKHGVISDEYPSRLIDEYFDCLFGYFVEC
jgi:hypothetical protein